jgi:hypothetical protein
MLSALYSFDLTSFDFLWLWRWRWWPNPASVGGLIVNTCGWIDGVGYELIRQAIDATRATVVLVLDNERLYSDLQQDLSQVQDRRTRTLASPFLFYFSSTVRRVVCLKLNQPWLYFLPDRGDQVVQIWWRRDPRSQLQTSGTPPHLPCAVCRACRVVCASCASCVLGGWRLTPTCRRGWTRLGSTSMDPAAT